MNDLEKFLQQMISVRAGMPRSKELKWSCLEELVLKFGKKYQWQPRPKKFRRGIPKHCFYNSANLAMRKDNLIYVEGYASMKDIGIALPHAWVVERGTDTVIDVTTDNFELYIGIPFSTKYLKQRRKVNPDGWSLLDDWTNDFPLLRAEEQEILGFLDRAA